MKKMLVGGVIGAGIGFGATFINPLMALFTSTTPVGWGIKAAAAGIGAAVGAGGALVMHLIGKHKQNLAMQAQAQATQQCMIEQAARVHHGERCIVLQQRCRHVRAIQQDSPHPAQMVQAQVLAVDAIRRSSQRARDAVE